MIHPDNQDAPPAAENSKPQSGDRCEGHIRRHPASSPLRRLRMIARAVRDQAGRLLRMVGAARGETFYRFLFENNPVPIAIYERGTLRMLAVNEAFIRLYGYSREETLGLRLTDFYPEEEQSRAAALIPTLNGYANVGEWHHRRRDGSTIAVVVTSHDLNYAGRSARVAVIADITERKRAEEDLRLANERLRQFVDSNIVGIVISSVAGDVIEANDYYLRLIGYTREELELGKIQWRTITPPEWLHADEQAIRELRERGTCTPYEKKYVRRDGSLAPVFQAGTMLCGPGEEMAAFVLDLTERERAEEALRTNELRFRSFIENAGVGIYRSTPEGRIIMANPALLRILGYNSFEEMASRNMEAESHGASYPRKVFRDRIEREGSLNGWEAAWTRQDGTTIFVRESATVIRGADGRALYYDGIIEDTSERRKAEQALRESEERFRNLTAAAFEGIVITDNGRIVDINDQGLRLFGCERAEMIGREALDYVSPESRPIVAENMRAQLELAYVHQLMRKDGSCFHAEARAKMMHMGNRLLRMTAIRDITEQRQAEQRQRNLEEQLHQMQKMEALGTLAAGIAHDFNNALAPILMAGPLLRSHVSDPGALHILDVVDKSSTRGAALVRQMLSFARGTAGQKQLVQVSHVLREVIDLAKITFPRSIRVVSHLPSDLWPVLSDPTQIHQVFLNLCINARDAMPEGGDLTLTAANRTLDAAEAARIPNSRPGTFLAVEVRDTGTGIPPEALERIWEPFFTTKGDGRGTGLGLSTVRSIVRQHDGFVTVLTSPSVKGSRGTAFTIFLEAVVEGAAADEADKQGDQENRGKGELILLVDDEESVCEIGARILTRHGYRAITARDGADAIAVFVPRASEVRLLLTDLEMPRVGGLALAITVRRLNPALPVIAMSGGASQITDGHKKIATAFLAKPFEAETLLSVVRRTLDEGGSAAPIPPKA